MKTTARFFCGTVLWVFVASCSGEIRFDDPKRTALSGCATDQDCRATDLHCDILSGACVACLDDADCAGTSLVRCDAALHQCVQCGADADCNAGQVCESGTRRCVPSCANGQQCPADAPTCQRARGICVRCTGDGDCAALVSTPFCESSNGQCVGCVADEQCAATAPRCDRSIAACVQCITSADCSVERPLCSPATRTCTEVEGHDDSHSSGP